jgi:hypothetical protein
VPSIVPDTSLPAESVTITITYPGESTIRQYRIDGGEWQNYTAPFTVSVNGLIEATCEDNTGRTSSNSYSITNIIEASSIRSSYVTTGDANAVDVSKETGISKVRIIQKQPALTQVKYLAAFNTAQSGITKWYTYAGGIWIQVDLTDVNSMGMTQSVIESVPKHKWAEIFEAKKMYFAIGLKSQNPSVTPWVGSITVYR